MKTSYFGKYKGPNAVAISCYTPPWFKGKCYPELAPDKNLIIDWQLKLVDIKKYTKRYSDLIKERKLTPEKIVKDLGNDAVLLCYETSEKFCHRHLIAEWLRKHGVDINEITD